MGIFEPVVEVVVAEDNGVEEEGEKEGEKVEAEVEEGDEAEGEGDDVVVAGEALSLRTKWMTQLSVQL